MILKLGNEGTVVRIFKTRSVCYDEIEYNGKFRKLWKTEMDKLAEFPAYESAESQMSSIPNDNGGAMFTAENIANAENWIEKQMQEIDAAFRRNFSQGLMGGAAVIKRASSDDKEYGTHPDFMPGRKVGEFIGVIRGAREYKPKMRKRIRMPEVEINEGLTVSEAWKDGRLDDLATEIVIRNRILAKDRGGELDKALTEKEKRAIFTAGRILTLFTYSKCKKQQGEMMKHCEPLAKEKLAEIMAININKAKKKLD
jgi:hypothetical protein